jgi:hypothetical protein
MINRCERTKSSNYPRYGGRGISVCEKWRHDFNTFLADMGRKPSPAHTLDRIDGNANYEPSNCRWASRKEQARHIADSNRRRAKPAALLA